MRSSPHLIGAEAVKATITNTSRAPQGVHSVDGLVFIEPGRSRVVDVADGYVARVNALSFLDVKWAGAGEKAADRQPAYEAKHRGRGSYSVMDATGAEMVEGLSKEQAEAFNAMSAEDRAAYVVKG